MARKRNSIVALLGALLALGGCGGGGGGGSPPPPTPLPPPPPPPAVTHFGDVTATAGINFQYGMADPALPGPQSDVRESTFGGVASGDCDRDGDIDLFVTYSDQRANRLYLNQHAQTGSFSFVDRAATPGSGVDYTRSQTPPLANWRHSGPVFADLDGDGWLDLVLGAIFNDEIKILRNDGDCTFTDVTVNSPQLLTANLAAWHTFSAGFGDYDLDGDLDMFLSHWGTPDSAYAGTRPTYSEHLWQNISSPGQIQFQNVSVDSGVAAITYLPRGWYPPLTPPITRCQRLIEADFYEHDYTFTGTFAHLNGDIWPDLLIVGDFRTSQILLNNGDGTFRDGSTPSMCDGQQPMGSALGDFDYDGDLDWFISSIRINFAAGGVVPLAIGNRLYRNEQVPSGNFALTDITDTGQMGVGSGGWGWGACFLDIDNDADLDIFHTNGFNRTATDNQGTVVVADFNVDPSRAFIYNGASFTEEGLSYGLNDTLSGRGVVCADFDNDGDLDIFQTTNRQTNSGLLRENRTAAGNRNYLKVKLTGIAPNTDAAGARIYVTSGGRTQLREVMVGSDNYTSQNPTVQHFGLGADAQVDIRIVWPARQGGLVQIPDTVLTLVTPVNRTLACNEATTTPTTCP